MNPKILCIEERIGGRKYMEDRIAHAKYSGIIFQVQIYAIFDGHGGSDVATYLQNTLHIAIIQGIRQFETTFYNVEKSKIITEIITQIKNIIREVFLKTDQEIYGLSEQNILSKAGSTAIVGIYVKSETILFPETLFIANLGDSRAILFCSNRVIFSTLDHKPTQSSELKRIEQAGGYILNGRVDGKLSLSRAFGDYNFKNNHVSNFKYASTESKVSPLPDISAIDISTIDISKNCNIYLMLASDGFWDFFRSGDELINFLELKSLPSQFEDFTPSDFNYIVDTASTLSHDNTSLFVVQFS
jgi:serine/threonine protein phosphatase PrpC